MNKLEFSTEQNPRLNNIEDGYELQKKFHNSNRWVLVDTFSGEYERNDHNFRSKGFRIWRDIFRGTLVKELWSTNRTGKINKVVFMTIECWPEKSQT